MRELCIAFEPVRTWSTSSLRDAHVAVLLICISGAVILHFITRYLYLRAHRQLALEGLQQAAATSASPGNHSNQSPGNVPQPGVEMHTVKPTVIVVQPDEEVSFVSLQQPCLRRTGGLCTCCRYPCCSTLGGHSVTSLSCHPRQVQQSSQERLL